MFFTLASTTAREDGLLGKRAYKSSSPTGTCTPQNITGESASISALLSAPFGCRDCSRRATLVAAGKRATTGRLSAAMRFFHFMPNTSAIYSNLENFSYRFIAEILHAVYWHTLCLNNLPLLHLFDVFLAPQDQVFSETDANSLFSASSESSSPKSIACFTTISGEEPRRKIRRKSSPPTMTVTSAPTAAPASSNATPVIMTIPIPSTATPTPLPTASKTVQPRRTQPSRQPAPPTRARAAVAQRDSASRAGSAHIVNDDAPLAIPPTRTGTGQGFSSLNKESAVKEELALRKEALFIIDQAEKMRAISHERGKRSGMTKRGGKRNGKLDDVGHVHDKESMGDGKSVTRNHDYSDDDNWDSFEGSSEGRQGRPALDSRMSLTSQTAKVPPALPPPWPFEVEFEEIQEYYRKRAEESRTFRSRERPFSERHSPVVSVATNGKDAMPRDETERGYYQGLSGLTEEMEANASGFVHNVRVSLITRPRIAESELTLNRQMSRR